MFQKVPKCLVDLGCNIQDGFSQLLVLPFDSTLFDKFVSVIAHLVQFLHQDLDLEEELREVAVIVHLLDLLELFGGENYGGLLVHLDDEVFQRFKKSSESGNKFLFKSLH